METLEAQKMMIEMDRKLWSGWKSRSICRPALSALQLLDVVTLQRHFSFNISRMSGVLFGDRKGESVVFSPAVFLSDTPSLGRPPHPNALSIPLSHSSFPSTFTLSFLMSPFSISERLKVYDSRMWSHTSPNIFNHTIKCHHFFPSILPEARPPPSEALRGLQRNLTHRCDPSSFITVFLQTHFCSVLFSPVSRLLFEVLKC